MSIAFDPATVVLPSEERSRALESTLMFKRRTIWIVYVGANAIAVGLLLWSMVNRSALLTPVDPTFRAAMIGLGVFLGILVAAVEREAWLLGFGGRRTPRGAFVTVGMLVLIAGGGFAGDFVARKGWEWTAFHGLKIPGAERIFTITARHSGRSGEALELRDPLTGQDFSITCSYEMFLATNVGERLILPVESGRGGAQRVTLPALRDLRRE